MRNTIRATARALLGLLFLIMGLNGFFSFLPAPASLPPKAGAFFGAMMATGYLIPLVSAMQAVAGVLLLINRFVPLALVILAPVVVNIAFYHIFLSPTMGVPLAAVALVLELYVAWAYREAFRPLLVSRTLNDGRRGTNN
ncbi:MAG TPA: hypothetical protein VFI41_03665 [Gemmatimonadales bacterium]|jgi:uncharacterized membrane protein YphA (DoxX/SURF4 family)|nr:hypothetical protein [Gemmatimonadales bacterium]